MLRVGPYRFFFYSNEGSEPPHIHVEADSRSAKFWLQSVRLATNHGFASVSLNEIERIVVAHRDELERAWHAYFQP
ncbi:MAG TPA: DUF4160 domain-containing protein [Ktedonobacterales bacterium]|nr:DUF4160 domain-containing protein [Ktedonobacterales bacterium]